jgi:hypothetical protein
VAAHQTLCGVLVSDTERQLAQVKGLDVGGSIAQYVGDDLVGLEERAQHGVGHQRALGPQEFLDGLRPGGKLLLPLVVPPQFLGDVPAERRRVGEVEIEFQQGSAKTEN